MFIIIAARSRHCGGSSGASVIGRSAKCGEWALFCPHDGVGILVAAGVTAFHENCLR
jgi:hypothetical protein